MKNWKTFLSTWATDGGSMFLLFILHNIILVCLIFGWADILKESYFLVLGALLGLLKGELHRKPSDNEKTEERKDSFNR